MREPPNNRSRPSDQGLNSLRSEERWQPGWAGPICARTVANADAFTDPEAGGQHPSWGWRVNREGVDDVTAVLADLFPTSDRGGYLGLVVTPDRRAFSFFLMFSMASSQTCGR